MMHGSAVHPTRLAPTAPALAALFVDERDRDAPLVAIPHPEVQLVVRFGPSASSGLDAHALGVRQTVRRKLVRAGQRTVMARVPLGAAEAVLGAPASALAGQIVALDALWGPTATRQLLDQLAAARTTRDAAAIVECAITCRLPPAPRQRPLALEAAARLSRASVGEVAAELGVSERHLRRVFHQAIGLGPKAFARLTRFHRALRAAHTSRAASWATIAVAAGYYDQAHLIDEFRAIAGATPRTLLAELRGEPASQSPAQRDVAANPVSDRRSYRRKSF